MVKTACGGASSDGAAGGASLVATRQQPHANFMSAAAREPGAPVPTWQRGAGGHRHGVRGGIAYEVRSLAAQPSVSPITLTTRDERNDS